MISMPLLDYLNAFRGFLDTGDDYLWLIDERVFFDGKEDAFHLAMEKSGADLLATQIRMRRDDPGWNWWPSLTHRHQPVVGPEDVAALLPLSRFSRAAAKAVLDGWASGWEGFPEALLPTLVARAGLRIEEIGGQGPFTPEQRSGCWYDDSTWHWQACTDFVPGKLHFPLQVRGEPMAPSRLDFTEPEREPRILLATPAGGGSASRVESMVNHFHEAGVDCWVFVYDGSEFRLPPATRMIREAGQKWQLMRRHLAPAQVADYDFLFIWDDDLQWDHLDPHRFVRIMRSNRLAMAQPAIVSHYGISHPITRQQRCEAPWRFADGSKPLPVVGRLTNFVEIMAPVFTRAAWSEFHGYLDDNNRSGWGYDYIPLGRKGVIDALPVEHTRPVGSICESSERDIKRFLSSQGLMRHEHLELGTLFGPV